MTYASLRSFLLARTDESLRDLRRSAEFDLHRGCSGHDRHAPPGGSPADVLQLRTADGHPICTLQVEGFSGSETPSPPDLPETIAIAANESRAFTVGAQEGGSRYRLEWFRRR